MSQSCGRMSSAVHSALKTSDFNTGTEKEHGDGDEEDRMEGDVQEAGEGDEVGDEFEEFVRMKLPDDCYQNPNMHISIHTDKSTPIWTVRGAICDGHLPQKLFNKYEKKCVKLVNALADRKLTNVEAQRVVRIVEVLRRRVLLMGLLEDMLKNTDHYEHFMTPNALNILEEIRTIKDAMKQMSRKGTSLIVSSSSSFSKGTSNHFRASQILSDNSLVADLTPMHPMLSDGDDTTALSSKNRPVGSEASQSVATNLEAKHSLGSMTFSSSGSHRVSQSGGSGSVMSGQDIGSKFPVLPPIKQKHPSSSNISRKSKQSEDSEIVSSIGESLYSGLRQESDQTATNKQQPSDHGTNNSQTTLADQQPDSEKMTPGDTIGDRQKTDKMLKLQQDLEQAFRRLLREFGSASLFDRLDSFQDRAAGFSKQLTDLFYRFARILLERLLTTSDEEFIKKHFIQGVYERIELNEQLLETKIDNLVCIKESEKEQMDRNGAEIEERKERMRQLDFMRHNEIQRIIERREEEELRRLQAYEAELKSEMAELQHIKSELRHHSDSNRKRSSKTRYEIEECKEDIVGLVGNYDRKMMGDRDRADWLEGELKRQEAREQQVEQSMHSVREEFERRQAVRNEMIRREFYRMNRNGNILGREWRGYLMKRADPYETDAKKKKRRGKGKKGGKKGGAKKAGVRVRSPRKPIIRGVRGGKRGKKKGKKGKKPAGQQLGVIQEVDDDPTQEQ